MTSIIRKVIGVTQIIIHYVIIIHYAIDETSIRIVMNLVSNN